MPKKMSAKDPKLRTSVLITRAAQPPALASSDNRRLWLAAFALCALTLLVFLQTTHFEFINFDDDRYVSEHPIILKGLTLDGLKYAFTSYKYYYWHPVTWLSHMLDCQLFGPNAGWHHLTNVLLHTTNVLLIFFLLIRLTGGVLAKRSSGRTLRDSPAACRVGGLDRRAQGSAICPFLAPGDLDVCRICEG